jgi:hypothetical protein
MGLNLKNADKYKTVKPKDLTKKLDGIAKRYLTKAYKHKQGAYYNNEDFRPAYMGVENPFAAELKTFTLLEIVVRGTTDTLVRETLSVLTDEFTNRVVKVEAENIKVVRVDNNQAKLQMMYEAQLDILRASKSGLLGHELFRFNNGKNYDNDITVSEYLNEFCLELVLDDSDDAAKQVKFVGEVRMLFSQFLKAYGLGMNKKYQFKSSSSLKGALSGLEVSNEGNVMSNSKIVRWVYKDSTRDDEDNDY